MISNVTITELFPTPVLIFDVDLDIDAAFEETMVSETWKDELLDGVQNGSVMKQIYDKMHEEIGKFSKQYELPGEVKLATVWRIWHEYKDRETAHFHFGGFFSSVLYLKTPEGGGDLMVLDPRGPICWSMFNTEHYNSSPGSGASDCRVYHRIKPKAGRVVVLPSWLMHYSEQNFSQEDPRVLVVSDWTLTGWENTGRNQDTNKDVKTL